MSQEDDEIEHSERGPSTAHRWRPCPGSVALSRGLPNVAGMEASIGTCFHEIASDCLEFGIEPQVFVGHRIETEHGLITFDQTMADNMLYGLDFVNSVANTPGAKLLVERRVSLERWVGKGEFGTTDAAIIDTMNWRLIVFDWKYGAGVPVSPEWNDQAMLYALGTWDTLACDLFADAFAAENGEHDEWPDRMKEIEVVIVVEQPRAPGGGGSWSISLGDLLKEGRKIKRDAERTEKPDAPIVPGEKQCKFCLAAKFGKCETRIRSLVEMAGADFDGLEAGYFTETPIDLIDVRALSPEARSQLLLNAGQIKALLSELDRQAYRDAEMGRPVPGLKLVPGRSPARKWKDEKRSEIVLTAEFGKDRAFSRKLRSPTDIEGEVGKAEYNRRYANMVDKGKAKPILVPSDDKREAIPDVTSDFDDL